MSETDEDVDKSIAKAAGAFLALAGPMHNKNAPVVFPALGRAMKRVATIQMTMMAADGVKDDCGMVGWFRSTADILEKRFALIDRIASEGEKDPREIARKMLAAEQKEGT